MTFVRIATSNLVDPFEEPRVPLLDCATSVVLRTYYSEEREVYETPDESSTIPAEEDEEDEVDIGALGAFRARAKNTHKLNRRH